jgi:hypothetical protein
MSGFVKPVKDHFIGNEMKKPVQFYISAGISSNKSEGQVVYYIKSKHGWISKYEKGEGGVYESWYA